MSKMCDKVMKDRSTNFSKEEVDKLMALIKDYPVITCKKTDHSSSQQKEAAWRRLTDDFNQNSNVFRSKKQLLYKFNNLKKIARKEMSAEKKARRQTGGGPPPPKPSTPTEWINSVMGESITGLPSTYDSDRIDESITLTVNNEEKENAAVNAFPNVPDLRDCVIYTKDELLEKNYSLEIEDSRECEKIALSQTNDSSNHYILEKTKGEQDVTFDTTTPKSMLRKNVSKELYVNKKNMGFTPVQTRKKIVNYLKKKDSMIESKTARVAIINKLAEEEHAMNMRHKEEKHKAEIKLINIEAEYKAKLYQLSLEKAELEIMVEKAKLRKLEN